MKQKIFLFLFFSTITAICIAQTNDTLFNQVDAKGLKQGYWKKHYPNGNLQYTGYFKNNKPLGEFKRYNREGELLAIMDYPENSSKIYTKIFYPNNQVQAEGFYINKQKDSIWQFFTENKILVSKINFVLDKKHGLETRFFDNGDIFEKIEWKNGIQDGITLRYYENGNVMIRATYNNGILHGLYSSFNSNGKPIIYGKYENNRREGKWITYDESGKPKNEINYLNGIADNQEELDRIEQEEIEMLEKNKGKFIDPMEKMYNNIPPM